MPAGLESRCATLALTMVASREQIDGTFTESMHAAKATESAPARVALFFLGFFAARFFAMTIPLYPCASSRLAAACGFNLLRDILEQARSVTKLHFRIAKWFIGYRIKIAVVVEYCPVDHLADLPVGKNVHCLKCHKAESRFTLISDSQKGLDKQVAESHTDGSRIRFVDRFAVRDADFGLLGCGISGAMYCRAFNNFNLHRLTPLPRVLSKAPQFKLIAVQESTPLRRLSGGRT
jgi:hypothetical protein